MRAVDIVRKVAPHARPEYVQAFEQGDSLLKAAGITTPQRLAHFLAQTLEETGGYTITDESGNYSAARMHEVWPGRFPTSTSGAALAHNPQALFNQVYAGRMGNGPPSSGDGFRYRGRGILQTTGREAYRKYGKRCGADFEGNPDLIVTAQWALKPALGEWVDGGCNAMADANDLHGITHRINGGYTGLSDRQAWFHRVRPLCADFTLSGPPVKPAAPVKPGVGAVIVAAGTAAGTAHASGWQPEPFLVLALVAVVIGVAVWNAMRTK